MCARCGKGAGHYRFARVKQNQEETIYIPQILLYIVADNGRRLGVILIQLFGDFYQLHQVASYRRSMLFGLRIEDVHSRGSWIKVNRVSPILNSRLAFPVIQPKLRRRALNGPSSQMLWYYHHVTVLIYASAGIGEHLPDIPVLNFDARRPQQLERFVKDLFD
jgi:hypothetical protein